MFLVAVLLLVVSCSSKDDAGAITEVVKKGVSLAEAHDIAGMFKLTTEDFIALPGKLDRRETRRILFMAFHHYGEFKVLYPRPGVEVRPDRLTASAVFPFLIVKKETSLPGLKDLYENPKSWLETVGENADLYRLKLELIRDGGDWLVSQALLERFTGASFAE
jgi:hypothetical protein